MSIKKRFTIAPDLAKGIRSSIQSASTNQGQLHYDMMSLDVIEPDPQNPRRLSITQNEILGGIDPSQPNELKQKELDALKELSESIKKIGIRNAIEVYKDGLKYRIITGERRYWAAMLAGQKAVPVRVNQKPDEFNLRYTQWVENINRQDLSLAEKFNNLKLLADAHKNSGLEEEFNEQVLQNLLGISSIQAYRYICLLRADEKIIQLVEAGKLNNLKIVQELVSMKDKGARNQIVSWIQSSKDEVTTLTHYRDVAGRKTTSKTQKKQPINLGKIQNVYIAQELFKIILSDSRFTKYHQAIKIDWHSPKAITKAFQDLFKAMEKECRVEEIV